MEAQQTIGIEIVKGRPGSVPCVRQRGVGLVARLTVLYPLVDIVFGNVLERKVSKLASLRDENLDNTYSVVVIIFCISNNFRDARHSSDTYDALERQVCLQFQWACEIIRRDL